MSETVENLATEKLTEVGLGQQAIDELTGEAGAKKAASFTPVEEATGRFMYLLPYIKKFGSAMNQKGIVRVLHALAEFPIQEGKPNLKSKEEEQLFNVFQEVSMAKTIIVTHVLEQQKQAQSSTEAGTEKGVEDGNGN